MTLNRIDPSVLERTGVVERFNESVRQGGPRDKNGTAQPDAPAATPPQHLDRAEISETARRLMEIRNTVDQGREAVEALPDVRDTKIAEARRRLAQGFYNSLQVTEDVARKLDRTFDAIDGL